MQNVDQLRKFRACPIAQARGFKTALKELDCTQEELAAMLGLSRPSLANSIRLLGLPVEVLGMIERGEITVSHGRMLVGRSDAVLLAHHWRANKISVADATTIIQGARQCPAWQVASAATGPRQRRRPAWIEIAKAVRSDVVYFARAGHGGPVKIGTTSKLCSRLEQIQTGCPFEIDLIGIRPGGRDLEFSYHRRFALHRLAGEWFSPAEEICGIMEQSHQAAAGGLA